jgi:hypothetical protein
MRLTVEMNGHPRDRLRQTPVATEFCRTDVVRGWRARLGAQMAACARALVEKRIAGAEPAVASCKNVRSVLSTDRDPSMAIASEVRRSREVLCRAPSSAGLDAEAASS